MKNPFKQIDNFVKRTIQKRAEKILKKKQDQNEMWLNIQEYGLIQNGKSTLSAAKRKAVVKWIDNAIETGAIEVIIK